MRGWSAAIRSLNVGVRGAAKSRADSQAPTRPACHGAGIEGRCGPVTPTCAKKGARRAAAARMNATDALPQSACA